ncbi:hypothetical protein MKK58_13785 [Methylobacterium sp. J-078]|uniref:hypothetical protein n=1 Tax=Methylobacterium sp. J-078 TaxID=2836657 RepID=UPI001FBB67B1|nr:hypothetical protein [Methylobacterium sp. J-078]MCJ2045596.1 hypothetical protein [Methylobacterium sp. J-078]
MPSLKLSNPFRRRADRPSLKDRAASLKASAARLMGRKPDEADQGRRTMVAGSMAVAIAAPLPVLAGAILPPSASSPHPDQSLLDAEVAYVAARNAERDAKADHSRAYAAYEAALGELPRALVAPTWVLVDTAHPGMPLGTERIRLQIADAPGDVVVYRWTVESLHRAIAAMPRVYGRAGTTPKAIRVLRDILPIAEEYEARMAEARAEFGLADTRRRWTEAQTATRLARNLISEAAAVTPAGLAVKVRQATEGEWQKTDRLTGGLIQSAALVAGVTLIDSNASYDAAGWVQAWEAIGGKALRDEAGFAPSFHCPFGTSGEDGAALKAETTRLIAELEEHRIAIERHVKGRA